MISSASRREKCTYMLSSRVHIHIRIHIHIHKHIHILEYMYTAWIELIRSVVNQHLKCLYGCLKKYEGLSPIMTTNMSSTVLLSWNFYQFLSFWTTLKIACRNSCANSVEGISEPRTCTHECDFQCSHQNRRLFEFTFWMASRFTWGAASPQADFSWRTFLLNSLSTR